MVVFVAMYFRDLSQTKYLITLRVIYLFKDDLFEG